LEKFIAQAVLYRLDSPAMHETLTDGGADQDEARRVADAIQADTNRMDDLAAMWADGEISRAEWSKARKRIQDRLEGNRRTFHASRIGTR
jgi:site-specific DNA recombinase